ncbi:MAG: hypothetical protein H6Q68_2922 [Firmicutes bacterium]|nr:hypothetical protein [Bacillota bacterium]
MLIINFMIILIMFIGLMCTLAPRLYGTVIILVAAGIYAVIIGVSVFPLWVAVSLLMLTLMAEVVINGLRIFMTRHCEVSRIYSINTTVCNLAGIVVADALLGALIGITLWELLVGKTLFPRFNSISKVLVRLILAAVLRLICGLIMTIIVVKYMMYT